MLPLVSEWINFLLKHLLCLLKCLALADVKNSMKNMVDYLSLSFRDLHFGYCVFYFLVMKNTTGVKGQALWESEKNYAEENRLLLPITRKFTQTVKECRAN